MSGVAVALSVCRQLTTFLFAVPTLSPLFHLINFCLLRLYDVACQLFKFGMLSFFECFPGIINGSLMMRNHHIHKCMIVMRTMCCARLHVHVVPFVPLTEVHESEYCCA